MLVKFITLFLIAMAVLAIFGRLRFPTIRRRSVGKCSTCGRPMIGKQPCPCKAS